MLRVFSEKSKKAAIIPTTIAARKQRIGTKMLLDSEVNPTVDVGIGPLEGNEVG